jgi:hypothetical protein
MRSTIFLALACLGLSACGSSANPADAGLPDTAVGQPDAAPCLHCMERAMMSTPTEPVCGASQPIYDALQMCLCMGPCMTACGDNACMSMPPSTACVNCAADTSAAGCGTQFNACQADHP